ncbi:MULTISPECIES: hypothetical protein [unclassified Massilia]|uniref:hypothetical protein n=1 Tax=unclassified Massilia TaxID=2609279 RepID=UPI001784544D|nr:MULTISPECIES: hypothetical protein [unclassified Massilia]MBD8529601.1 hypothetical protein [Massilia sp. CFBP 13647]MBD8673312.1 hypothetical protein [Massilia sp. CFBP 13721]
MNKENIVRTACVLATTALLASLTGCASIVSGTNQVVSVETISPAGKLDGATCKLQNDKGVYYVTTPGTVTVHRAYGDMNVTCDKAGMGSGVASFKSSTKGMMAGNLLFGGVIGAGVDAASGAAYDYPALLQIMMNDSISTAVATALPAAAVTGGSK